MSEDLEEVQFSEGQRLSSHIRTWENCWVQKWFAKGFKRRVSLYSGALLFGETAKISQKSDTDPEDDERGINTSGWGILPDLVIEKVFSYLSIPQRYSASMVCQQWQRVRYPTVWEFSVNYAHLFRFLCSVAGILLTRNMEYVWAGRSHTNTT